MNCEVSVSLQTHGPVAWCCDVVMMRMMRWWWCCRGDVPVMSQSYINVSTEQQERQTQREDATHRRREAEVVSTPPPPTPNTEHLSTQLPPYVPTTIWRQRHAPSHTQAQERKKSCSLESTSPFSSLSLFEGKIHLENTETLRIQRRGPTMTIPDQTLNMPSKTPNLSKNTYFSSQRLSSHHKISLHLRRDTSPEKVTCF